MRLEALNNLDRDAFVSNVGWVYECSPWVAERAWNSRPFSSLEDLCEKMISVVQAASPAEQVALLRAHPDLGTRAKVSLRSESEQAGAGLDKLTTRAYECLTHLNTEYKAKFGFPFLYAVKGSSKQGILTALQIRLAGDPGAELLTALEQVYRIARFRLEDIVK